MAFPEYERIAGLPANRPRLAPSNLPGIEEEDATGEVSTLYEYFRSRFGRPQVPGILKCFATHPPLLRHMMDLSESLLFTEGELTRRHKEMIATAVSSQNDCPYCADGHGYFLRVHGGSKDAVCAIQANKFHAPSLTTAEQMLLIFTQKVNQKSQDICKADVEVMHQAGWNDPQIAEAVHVAALFATFNRVANAFGLKTQGLLAHFEEESDTTTTKTQT
jgi:uncharacterized peroxidase-related enzyme